MTKYFGTCDEEACRFYETNLIGVEFRKVWINFLSIVYSEILFGGAGLIPRAPPQKTQPKARSSILVEESEPKEGMVGLGDKKEVTPSKLSASAEQLWDNIIGKMKKETVTSTSSTWVNERQAQTNENSERETVDDCQEVTEEECEQNDVICYYNEPFVPFLGDVEPIPPIVSEEKWMETYKREQAFKKQLRDEVNAIVACKRLYPEEKIVCIFEAYQMSCLRAFPEDRKILGSEYSDYKVKTITSDAISSPEMALDAAYKQSARLYCKQIVEKAIEDERRKEEGIVDADSESEGDSSDDETLVETIVEETVTTTGETIGEETVETTTHECESDKQNTEDITGLKADIGTLKKEVYEMAKTNSEFMTMIYDELRKKDCRVF